jgi:hypothetical protein
MEVRLRLTGKRVGILVVIAASAVTVTVASAAGGGGRPATGAEGSKATVLGVPAAGYGAGTQAPPSFGVDAAPKGYVVVNSGPVTAPNGHQKEWLLACPAPTVVLGGGVQISSSSLWSNVGSSYPWVDRAGMGIGWRVNVNNASGSDTTFNVTAVCAYKPRGYKVRVAAANAPDGTQTPLAVACPPGKVALGGGGWASSVSTAVNLNTSLPTSTGWGIDVNNNNSGANTVIEVIAVCANPPVGYVRIAGPITPNPASSQDVADAACPFPKVPTGGGVYSDSSSLSVNIHSTFPISGGWRSYENNASHGDATLDTWVVCAGK